MPKPPLELLCFCCLFMMACAPDPAGAPDLPPTSATPFLVLDQTGQQDVFGIIELDDGGVALCGSERNQAGGWQLLILRIDAAGAMSWRRSLPSLAYGRASGLCERPGGDLLVCASQGDADQGERCSRLVRLSAQGEVLFDRVYSGRAGLQFCSLTPLNDSSCLIAGGAIDPLPDGGHEGPLYLMACDETGEILWERRQRSPGCHAWYNRALVRDGWIIAFGEGAWAGRADWQGIMAGLDLQGHERWLQTVGGEGNEEGYGLCGSIKRGWLGCGFSPSDGQRRGYAAWFDAAGSLQRQVFFSEISIVAAVEHGDLETLLLTSSQGQLVNHLLDDAGRTLWTRRHGMAGRQLEARALTGSRDGGFIVCGLVDEGPESDIVVLRLDADGQPISF